MALRLAFSLLLLLFLAPSLLPPCVAAAEDAADSRMQPLPFAWPDYDSYKVDVDFRTVSVADNDTLVHAHVEHWADLKHQRSVTIESFDGGRGHPPSKQYFIQSVALGSSWLYRPNLPCMKIALQESQLRHVHLPLPVDIPAWVDTGAAEYFQQGELIPVRRYILYDNSGKMFEALIESRRKLLLSATVKDTLQRPSPTVTLIDLNWRLGLLADDLRGAFELPAGVSCPDYTASDSVL